MKIAKTACLAAAATLLPLGAPAFAQDMHRDDHMGAPDQRVVVKRTVVRRTVVRDHDDRGRDDMMRHHGWSRHHERHCWTTWRHHHRERVCRWQ